jgi:hypothetical protein
VRTSEVFGFSGGIAFLTDEIVSANVAVGPTMVGLYGGFGVRGIGAVPNGL